MLRAVLREHLSAEAELSVTFVGERLIRRLNREYLRHDWVTDVISFDLSGQGAGRPEHFPLVGDIYICVPRARRQAREHGATEREELARLAIHGLLHLLGYDHEQPDQAGEMNALQEEAVAGFRREATGGAA